ncbi:MAG TPA: hypothetical protein VLI93_06410 [Acetobacteraceae bacterium]|nr:hypothetical protein [Acetobacteraceae bacterium]
MALPPPGTDLGGAEHTWWECWRQPISHKSCCSEADGHSVTDGDWRPKPDGSNAYQVRIEGQWWDVPPETVINASQKCGPEPNLEHRADAKVWYTFNRDLDGRIESIGVRCFKIGTEY